jgi:pimeloyl-ACP methyl ester carboxylesterase
MDALAMRSLRERRVSLASRGGAMAGIEFGDPARRIDVVFLHANGFNARTYAAALEPLGDRLRILAVDQRGHGRTDLPTATAGRTSWYDFRDDLLGLLEAQDLRNVVLAGHSMGGTASLLAQACAPERVKALALFDPVVMPPMGADFDPRAFTESPLVQGALRRRAVFPDRESAFSAYRGRGAFRTWPDEMLADYLIDGLRPRPDGQLELACAPEWEASNFRSHGHDPWAAFAAARAPIRILRAEEGSTTRDGPVLEDLVARGRVRIETVPGTTHFLPMERPDLVRSVLLEAVTQ